MFEYNQTKKIKIYTNICIELKNCSNWLIKRALDRAYVIGSNGDKIAGELYLPTSMIDNKAE